ncbi:MAG: hypothetical protein ABRQ23_10875 [Syntrophomonadaceae bacterium]
MKAFRILLVVMTIWIVGYTSPVVMNYGLNFFPQFFGDMAAMTWAGQFNSDFICFLLLSGLWLAWRHQFTPGGIFLGMLGFFGGISVLAPYLLFISFRAKGDIAEILLGKSRAKP